VLAVNLDIGDIVLENGGDVDLRSILVCVLCCAWVRGAVDVLRCGQLG
jgi:hypothetical protein